MDSVGSDASAASNGRGKKVRGNAPVQPGKLFDAKAPGCDLTCDQTYQWLLRMRRCKDHSKMKKKLGNFPTFNNLQNLCLAFLKYLSQRLRLRNPFSLPLRSAVPHEETGA